MRVCVWGGRGLSSELADQELAHAGSSVGGIDAEVTANHPPRPRGPSRVGLESLSHHPRPLSQVVGGGGERRLDEARNAVLEDGDLVRHLRRTRR